MDGRPAKRNSTMVPVLSNISGPWEDGFCTAGSLQTETPGSFFSTFVAQVDGRAEDHLAAIRDTIQSVDPQVPVFGAKTMEQRLDEVFAGPKFYRTAVWIFAGFALLLAVIGIYGIVSYAVVRRTQEWACVWRSAQRRCDCGACYCGKAC